jgi:hypothetical protein
MSPICHVALPCYINASLQDKNFVPACCRICVTVHDNTHLLSTVSLMIAQANNKSFDTPEALLRAVDLYNLTQKSFIRELEVCVLPDRSSMNFHAAL